MRYIAVDFLKKGHFAVDFQLNRGKRCRMTTTLAHHILRLQIGRAAEFHRWNSRVPLLELTNSTAGTHEFHPWNFLELLIDGSLLTALAEELYGLNPSTKWMRNAQLIFLIMEKSTAKSSFFKRIYCKVTRC